MSTVTLINFKRAKGLNHGPFHSFLEETDSGHGTVPYHTEAQWPNPAKVLIYVVAWGRECHHRASGWKWRRDLAFLWDITKHMMQWQLSRQSCACGTLRCSKETSVTLYWQDIFFQFDLCSYPSAVDVERAPINLQMQLIDVSVIIHSKQSMPMWALHSFQASSLQRCLNSVYMLLKCTTCLEATMWAAFLWWRWTKTHKGVVSLMLTFTPSRGFPPQTLMNWQPRKGAKHLALAHKCVSVMMMWYDEKFILYFWRVTLQSWHWLIVHSTTEAPEDRRVMILLICSKRCWYQPASWCSGAKCSHCCIWSVEVDGCSSVDGLEGQWRSQSRSQRGVT